MAKKVNTKGDKKPQQPASKPNCPILQPTKPLGGLVTPTKPPKASGTAK